MASESIPRPPKDSRYRAACEAAGWGYISDSAVLDVWVGQRDGIAHLATVAGTANESDSVYETWEACWRENVGGEAAAHRQMRSEIVARLRAIHTQLQSMGEVDLQWLTVAEARLFVTASEMIGGLASDITEKLEESDAGRA